MEPIQLNPHLLSCYEDNHLRVDVTHRVATLDSTLLTLTRKECDLLHLLVQNAGAIVPRETPLLEIWGYGKEIRTRTLDTHICRLRRQLCRGGWAYIETIVRVGYRFHPFSKQCDAARPIWSPWLMLADLQLAC